ncbi:hypothetical protein BGZ49_004086 [Haplosporangium sp. Z 27]|nr:hypothetical protein BGZ49_004086 [Haplosporangium sp. Z 27]
MATLPSNRFSETKFSESFWSNSRGDYVTGINVLHGKIDQGAVEDQEIMTYIKERIDVEQRYGNALIEMGNRRLKLDGFLRDDGASLRKTFETIKAESVELGNGHLALAANLRELVLQPLVRFTAQARQTTQQSHDDIENRLKLFDKHLLELDRSHANYISKCNAADQAEMEASKIAQEDAANGVNPEDVTDADRRHEFASQRFTIHELNKFLNRMRAEVPSQDVKVPIMGVYNNCCSGSSIAHWIQQNTKARTIEEAEHIGQSLSDEGFLRLIGQRGNKFLASPANFYQWRDQMFELLEEDNKEEEVSLVKRTKLEVERADALYLTAVKKADMTRLQLEVAFLNYAAIFSNIISITQSVADHLLIFQEALRPANDVQYIIEQYRTGAFVPMPTLYNNFYHGSGLDQVFGVNIDTHCNFTRKKVPQIVMKCLTRIKKSSVSLTNEQKLACWTADVPLADIHVLRNKINHGGKITQKLLRLFDMATVVGVLRLYFLELPGSLLNGEEYDTVKIIYSSVSDDVTDSKSDARISSIRNLLALLSSARFYTLYEVVKHISGLIKETSADDSFTSFVAHRWGPVFLRPLEETAVTLHDKHPQRMMRDMLKMTHQIFEPIRMQREDGNLSRSTTRVSAHPRQRKDGPSRLSRDLKGSSPLSNGNGHVGLAQVAAHNQAALPAVAVEGSTAAVTQDGGSGVGVGSATGAPAPGGAKLARRFGPNGARFNLTRGVSAPEMFSEVPLKKKPAVNGEGGEESTAEAPAAPGLLNTKGLLPAAGGDKGGRSPLRRSIVSTTIDDIAEGVEEKDEEDKANVEETATDVQIKVEEAQEPAEEVTKDGDEDQSTGDWKPVSGAEFEASGRKLERRRKNRQSGLSSNSPSSDVSGLSAESVLQALREEDNK